MSSFRHLFGAPLKVSIPTELSNEASLLAYLGMSANELKKIWWYRAKMYHYAVDVGQQVTAIGYSTINARAEGVRTAASYREPFSKGRRCIVPASGYFEWTGPKNDRQPHYFTRADVQPMALAGLWDRWRSKDKSETKETFTIVTTGPNKFAAQFHNRMPVILEPDTWDRWMKGEYV